MKGEVYQFPLSTANYLAVAQKRGLLAHVNNGRKLQRFVPVTEYSPPKHSFKYVREFIEGLQCSLGFSINGSCNLETIEIWREPPYLEIPYGDAVCFDRERLKLANPNPQIVNVAYEPDSTEGNFCFRFNDSGHDLPLIEVSASTGLDAFSGKNGNEIIKIDPNFPLDPGAAKDICFSGNAMLEFPKTHNVFQAEKFCQKLEAVFSPFFPGSKAII